MGKEVQCPRPTAARVLAGNGPSALPGDRRGADVGQRLLQATCNAIGKRLDQTLAGFVTMGFPVFPQ